MKLVFALFLVMRERMMAGKSYNKYKNIKSEVDGIKFDSKLEMEYYLYLKALQKDGIVTDFEIQKKFLLQEKTKYKGQAIREINYIADFYVNYTDGHTEIIDIKGSKFNLDNVFKLKRKMLIYKYPDIDFRVISRRGKKGSYEWYELM